MMEHVVAGMLWGVFMSATPEAAAAEAPTEPAPAPASLTFRAELEPVYRQWVEGPGAMLSVLDSISDVEEARARVGIDAAVGFVDLTAALRPREEGEGPRPGPMARNLETLKSGDLVGQFFVGERNNPYFTYYTEEFREAHPEAFMLDKDGNLIEVISNPIGNRRNPVPAVDDPTIMRLASELIRREVESVGDDPRVRGWFIGSEEAYPDYFGLPVGDFREASKDHYKAFAARTGLPLPVDPAAITAESDSPARAAWYIFREQAIADRASGHMQSFLSADRSRPVMYPTHGHPFAGDMRRKLGQPPALLAGACDGFEMGHITIDNDDENLNLLYLANYTAYGVPTVAPRLGNKTLDEAARGGGRSFTPPMLRRLLYECLGMGVWHIGPIHWRASLGDGEWFIKDTPAEAECAAVFAEFKRLRPVLAGMSRLQPAVGLYVSDDTWLKEWNPRWTAFIQDAVAAHWNVTMVNDALLGADLAARMPVLVSLENTRLSEEARRGLDAYVDAGGRVYAWGGLGTEDALGRSAAAFDRAVVLDLTPESETRTLVNQFQTGDGAWQWPHEFRALPVAAIEGALLKDLAEHRLRPIDVEAARPKDLEVFTLTEGLSLATVIVNRGGEAVEARVKIADGLLPDASRLVPENALEPGEPLPVEDGRVLVQLEPHGTAVLWFHPDMSADDARAKAAAAESTVAAWREAGADTAPFEPLLQALRNALDDGRVIAKAGCLAEVIRASYAVKADAAARLEGGLELTARVFDSNGSPATDAAVRVRIVPGPFAFHAFEPGDDGVYRLTVPTDDLPRIYNFEKRAYEPLQGPARLVFTAHSETRGGGTMQVFDVPNSPSEEAES